MLIASPIDETRTKMDAQEIEAKAKVAKTVAEHLAVAQAYEARAEKLDAEAVNHEKDADKLAARRGYNPMAAKWPAVAQGPAHRARSLAMQARRQAGESRELAAKHRVLARSASAAM
jgi:hypothetical protein